jgi:hypothetical protein
MTIDFQQVQKQIQALGETALLREQRLLQEREKANQLLREYAGKTDQVRQKILSVVKSHDPSLRCALPVEEPLDSHFEEPALPPEATILAADGSQIAPDRTSEVHYCLLNVGAIQMALGKSDSPHITVESQLFYDDNLYKETGTLTEEDLALMRDVSERSVLSRLAVTAPQPVITFTDGPMELWGGKDSERALDFQEKLKQYHEVLEKLCSMGTVTAGYVDKPAANLVVRTLEILMLTESDFGEIKKWHPLRGVSDMDLYRPLLKPGERSAVFAIQSKAAASYRDNLALHFFYLNVGRPEKPWLARVEIPAWVMKSRSMLDMLQAVLLQQSRIMGSRTYPYLLHRAHEAAVVTLQEKEQVTKMIVKELIQRGIQVGSISQKQAAKNMPGRMRY